MTPTLIGSSPTLIGCGPVGCVVGAEALGQAAGVWVKTHFHRQGPFLCATVYSVSAGEPKVLELRVDLRPIERALMRHHSALHAQAMAESAVRGTTVGWSLGKMWKGVKKAASTIGRNKLVKGVTGAVMSVARNKAFQVAVPVAALSAHTLSRSAGGKGAFKGSLGRAVDLGSGAVLSAVPAGSIAKGISASPLLGRASQQALGAYAAANQALTGVAAGRRLTQVARSAASAISRGRQLSSAVQSVNQRTAAAVKTAGALMPAAQKRAVASAVKAAGTLKLNAKGKAAVASTLARAPATARAKVASAVASKLKGLATLKSRAALAKALPPTARAAVVTATRLQVTAAPAIKKAATTKKALASPAVRKRMTDIAARGAKAEGVLRQVAERAKTGGLDAQKSAAIVNLVARNNARLQAMSQANAGGLPGLLITKDGKLKRGRFRVEAVAQANGVLYTGPKKPTERGTFTTVSGLVGWGSGGDELESIAINGDLPLDGVRLFGKGANAYDVYDAPMAVSGGARALIGCGTDSRCAPCARSA